jgi:hypothetical protein
VIARGHWLAPSSSPTRAGSGKRSRCCSLIGHRPSLLMAKEKKHYTTSDHKAFSSPCSLGADSPVGANPIEGGKASLQKRSRFLNSSPEAIFC